MLWPAWKNRGYVDKTQISAICFLKNGKSEYGKKKSCDWKEVENTVYINLKAVCEINVFLIKSNADVKPYTFFPHTVPNN